MKKRFIAILLVMVACMYAFSACSALGNLEKDVQVYLQTESGVLGPYTVNAFNNAIVPEQEAPKGKNFLGWTDDENWATKDLTAVSLTENRGLIRFDDVKKYAEKGSVTLYPVFGEIARHDVAIAWYAKENTSGLNQSVMDNFLTELKVYLAQSGKNPDNMDIVVRAYDGNVGTSCGNIMKDADIDIMLGWAAKSNIEGTGGLKAGEDFFANYGNITLTGAAKARYAARLGDTELVKEVYNWILTTYSGDGGATKDYDVADTPVTPNPDPDPTPTPDPDPTPEEPSTPIILTDKVLTVSVWNNSKGEWITDEQVALLKTDFNEYLTKRGVNVADITFNWIIEKATKVADLGASVNNSEITVDFILACGANVTSQGKVENLTKTQIANSKYMAENRYIAVLHKDDPNQLAQLLYEFMSGTKFPIELTDNVLTVSVWNNAKGEWITNEQLESLKTDFKAYLTECGVNVDDITFNWIIEEATKVADLGASVNNSETTVDFILACGANVTTQGKVENLVKIKIANSKYMAADRYVAVLHQDAPNQLAKILYEFMSGAKFVSESTETAQGGSN